MRISDWSSDVCSSDLSGEFEPAKIAAQDDVDDPADRIAPILTSRRRGEHFDAFDLFERDSHDRRLKKGSALQTAGANIGIGNPAAVYEDQCSIKTEAAQVDLRIAGVALSCSRDAGIGAEKVAKECVEVGRPRALDFLARENRIGLRLILAARDVARKSTRLNSSH